MQLVASFLSLPSTDLSVAYLSALTIQTLLATVLFSLVGAAYYHRRTLPYLLIWIATSTLIIESIVSFLDIFYAVSPSIHLLLDHALDILLVLAVLTAVYTARRIDPHTQNHDSV